MSRDYWRICDVCGFRYRASATLKRWDGAIVCLPDWESQHPQDFVRGKVDNQLVPDPRPEPVDNIVGPLTTTTSAAASAGATTISVASSVRMNVSDRIGIALEDGTIYRAIINTVPTVTSIVLTAATKLPGGVAAGAIVIDYSAIAQPDIG